MAKKQLSFEDITDEHKKIVWLQSHGATYKETAVAVNVPEYDLRYILKNLRSAFGCKSSSELVAFFLRKGLIE